MNRIFFSVYIAGFLMVILLMGEECRAEFTLHPGVYMRIENTDNLFLTEAEKTREWIATIAPNFRVVQRGKLFNLELEYAYERYRYLNESTSNERGDSHLGRLDAMLLPERDISLEMHGDASLQAIDRRRSDVVDSSTINTTNRYLGRIRPAYRHDFGSRLSSETAYVYENIRYDGDVGDNTQSQKVEQGFLRRQSGQLDLLLDGFYEKFTAESNQDYDRLQGMAGGEWRLAESTTLSVKGGMTWFEYETGETFNTRVYDCKLLYTPVQRWALNASYVKNFGYDVIEGLYRTWLGEGAVSYSGRLSWRLGLLIRIDEYVLVDRDDREQGVVGEISYKLTPKVLLGIRGDGRQFEFAPVIENVDRYSLGASVKLTPREYIEIGCQYVYRNNDSDLDLNDYSENRFACDLRLTYNMIP